MADDVVQVAVLGGGLSGLALGVQLQRRGLSVRVLESRTRAGGNIRSERCDGYLCEWGPNGFLDNEPASLRLITSLGLDSLLVRASDTFSRRWIVRNGKLRALPGSPPQFLRSDILSTRGKLRVLLEWAQSAKRDDTDESVFDFAARRIGREAASVLVDAMVTGVYAGDSRRLSLLSTFPRMHELERDHGGLFRAMRAARKARAAGKSGGSPFGPSGTLRSFQDGMETLIAALSESLGPALTLETRVATMHKPGARWLLELSSGSTVQAERVVLACPSWTAADVVRPLNADLANELAGIGAAPVAVVFFGYEEDSLRDVERGFGFLVPGQETLPVLGTLYESWVFPNRAPNGQVLFRTLIGGARDPDAVHASDEQLFERARQALSKTLGLTANPVMTYVVRQKVGIPQYIVGHEARLKRIDAALARTPGLMLTGYSYRGIAMNACMKNAEILAEDLAVELLPQRGRTEDASLPS